MTFNEYQKSAMRTQNNKITDEIDVLIEASLGLNGESGEFSDILKKCLYQGHDLDKTHLIKESGDILWYIALACTALNIPMEEIAKANIAKLKARYPDGFTETQSNNRKDRDI